jgi:RHS repeat-associated protein
VNCGSGFSQTITVGALGNLTKSGTLSFMPGFNTATNHITSVGGQNYTYDLDGNLLNTGTGVGTNTYTWNSWGGMTGDTPNGSTPISITYDALGRIGLEQKGSTYTSFVYGPTGEKLALMNGQTLNQARLALPGGGMAVYDPTGLIRYWHGDWQGSVRLLSSPDQTYNSSGAAAPYGESYAENPVGFLSPFAGLISDTSSELNDALWREYDPTQGRWMSPDPAGLAAVDLTNPQSLNRYAYVGNNPATAIDPSGMNLVTIPFTGVGGFPGEGLCNDDGYGDLNDCFGIFLPEPVPEPGGRGGGGAGGAGGGGGRGSAAGGSGGPPAPGGGSGSTAATSSVPSLQFTNQAPIPPIFTDTWIFRIISWGWADIGEAAAVGGVIACEIGQPCGIIADLALLERSSWLTGSRQLP